MTRTLKLATENGRHVGRTAKAKRLAAKPATDAARLARSLGCIHTEIEKAQARGKAAEKVLEAAWHAACGEDRLVARALAREALIECGHALRLDYLLYQCERAQEGTLCA